MEEALPARIALGNTFLVEADPARGTGLAGFNHSAIGLALEGIGVHRDGPAAALVDRSEEHTSELQSLMRLSYAVFCSKKKSNKEREEPHASQSRQQHPSPHIAHMTYTNHTYQTQK